MQPHFGANRGRERRFAGDFASESDLVGRIGRSECPKNATNKRPTSQKAFTAPPQTSRRTAARIAGTVVHIEFKVKCQGTLKTRYFSVYLACMRVRRFLGGPFWAFPGAAYDHRRQALTLLASIPRQRHSSRGTAIMTGCRTSRVQSHPIKVH